MTLSPSQQKALDWLPSDGAWKRPIGSFEALDIIALQHARPDLVDYDKGNFFYRLTPKGIAYKAGREG